MNSDAPAYHTPVMLSESIDAMDIKPGGKYVDVTHGGGGHTREILRRMDNTSHLYAMDQDIDAMACAPTDDPRFTFIRSNFRYLRNFMRYYGCDGQIDAILADLGVSSHHFDEASRGFSFRADGPLDMRMNQQATTTAADIVNNSDEQTLANIFHIYGELTQSRQMARSIVKARAAQPLTTIGQLIDALQPHLPREREKKDLARAFQALRIEVNHEMDALAGMLSAATQVLRPGGRLVVITYHSLEDRMVKNLMRTGNIEGKEEKDFYGNISAPYTTLTRKPITPTAEEQQENPRSRSAKLRVGVKKSEQ